MPLCFDFSKLVKAAPTSGEGEASTTTTVTSTSPTSATTSSYSNNNNINNSTCNSNLGLRVLNAARKMNDEKPAMPVPQAPPTPSMESPAMPPKRKKGRPPKNRALLPGGQEISSPTPKVSDGRGRKPKRKESEVVLAPPSDGFFVGQQVNGVLDGSFEAGYLLTVRVGNTQTVLRGAVFEPSLAVPITKSNDIAPGVKFIERYENIAPLQYPAVNINPMPLPSRVTGTPMYVTNGPAAIQPTPMPMQGAHRMQPDAEMMVVEHVSNTVVAEELRDRVPTMPPPGGFGAEQKMNIQADTQMHSV